MRYIAFILFLTISVVSCRPENYVPKPRGYFEVSFPQHAYQQFDNPAFPYRFEYPTYAVISKDTVDKHPDNPYWINMDFPSLGGRVYLSYKQIGGERTLERLLEEAHFMSYYHSKKADYISDPNFTNKNGVSGVFYDVGGESASAYQFYATDSVRHFLRGALYFNVTPNADSLRPVNEFIRVDLEHMLQTLSWR